MLDLMLARPVEHYVQDVAAYYTRSRKQYLAVFRVQLTRDRRLRAYATETRKERDIAIIGSGITGLASAYWLSKKYPASKITIYEHSPNIGGWISSELVDADDGQVLFESGPRTLRPGGNGQLAQRLVHELGLAKDTIFTSKMAPAATNRFIYYPDRLVRLPGPGLGVLSGVQSMLTEPIFQGVIRNAFTEALQGRKSKGLISGSAVDVSVGDFFADSCGRGFVERTLSAMIHGIYAGDPWKLSMRSIFPTLWRLTRDHGSLLAAVFASTRGRSPKDPTELAFTEARKQDAIPSDLRQMFIASTVFTFREGLKQLPETLRRHLQDHAPNVRFQHSTSIKGVSSAGNAVALHYPDPEKGWAKPYRLADLVTSNHSEVVWTCRPESLLSRTREGSYIKNQSWSERNNVKSVTVMAVCLYFREPNLHPPGFGYLLPRATPFEQNPEMALGVIFDNCYSPAPGDHAQGPVQDTVSARGTKVTVMLGGHYWDNLESLPDTIEGARLAQSLLKRHLGINQHPVQLLTRLATKCIPQYEIGHYNRLAWLHEHLVGNGLDGKVHLAGNWINGVGINDCLRSAWDVVENFGQPRQTGLNTAVFGPQRPYTG